MSTSREPSSWDYVLQLLQRASSPTEELHSLEQLKKCLNANDDGSVEDDIEHQWLSQAADSLGNDDPYNPFPAHTPLDLFSTQLELDRFTSYLFVRRFSWSEAGSGQLWSNKGDLHFHHTASSKEKDAQLKGRLNTLLDDLLKWYLCQEISHSLLKSLQFTTTHACNMPVVRNQTIIHVMEWLQLNISQPALHRYFIDAQALVMSGICDVWSAIRNACVVRLGCIANNLTLLEVESIFLELAEICQSSESCWQSVEGALMAITMIVKCFQWISVLPTWCLEDQASSSREKYYLKFGEQELSKLPDFISNHMRMIVYPLLAHPQLGVRENATKALSTFLSRCEFKVALEALKEAFSKLCQDDEVMRSLSSDNSFQDTSLSVHHAVLQSSYTFRDAYEAEGLLSVCLYLIKHLQPGVLIPNWPDYFSTLSQYLMHPASTVRQSASVIFKYIVAKESSNPALLKLVLQALCANWAIEMDSTMYKPTCSGNNVSTLQQEWETFKHWTDGQSAKIEAFGRQFSTEQEKLISIVNLHLFQGGNFQEKDLCKAWEWREGRLFAYELIVKFLILNHIHYLFPSYALPPSKFDGSVSADDAIAQSRQSAQHPHPTMSKSMGHDGTSLRNTLAFDGVTTKYQCLTRSGSERHKLLQDKRASTLAEGTFFKKQLRKHYSYYNNEAPTREKKTSSQVATTSLLCKARNMDDAVKVDIDDAVIQMVPSPMALLHPVDRDAPPVDINMLLQTASKSLGRLDLLDLDWLKQAKLYKLSTLFRQMLLQTISCHGDGRWEVRRMAQQALPLITECIRWYDMTILTCLWDQYLSSTATLMCYGLALTLSVSINHAVRLIHFMDTPPVSWKDPDICRGITLPIITSVTEGLPTWCHIAQSLVDRTTVDKLTVIALEILMTTHTYFFDLPLERGTCEASILRRILHVFCHAHPDHSISQESSSDDTLNRFTTPQDGFLCCCSRAECTKPPARQVERYLLTELHHLIPIFLESCSDDGTCKLLPAMLHNVGTYHQDSLITKCLLDGCLIICNKAVRWLQQCEECNPGKHQLMMNLRSALQEVTVLTLHEELEMVTLKQVLDIALAIILYGLYDKASAELSIVLSAIVSRLNLSSSMDSTVLTSQNKTDEKDFMPDLVYLSNNIPASPVDNHTGSDDEEEEHKEHDSLNITAESLSLSVSGGSGQTVWPVTAIEQHRLSTSCDSQDDSHSDWDNWDEEPEDQLSLDCIVSDFMQKLQVSHKSIVKDDVDGQSFIILALHQLPENEQLRLNKFMHAS